MLAGFTDEDSITIVAFTIPGTTLASDEMVADIIAGLTDDAELAHFESCNQELVVVDTEFADTVERIRRNKDGSIKSGKWGEFWTPLRLFQRGPLSGHPHQNQRGLQCRRLCR